MGWPGATDFRTRDADAWVPIGIKRLQPNARLRKLRQAALPLLVAWL